MLSQHLRGFGNGTNYSKDWSYFFISKFCFLKHHFWSCKCLSVLIWGRQYQEVPKREYLHQIIRLYRVSYILQFCCCIFPACVGVATPPHYLQALCQDCRCASPLEEPVKVSDINHTWVLKPSWKCSGRLSARGCNAALLGEGCSTHWESEEETTAEGNLPVLSLFSELLGFSGI